MLKTSLFLLFWLVQSLTSAKNINFATKYRNKVIKILADASAAMTRKSFNFESTVAKKSFQQYFSTKCSKRFNTNLQNTKLRVFQSFKLNDENAAVKYLF